MPKVLRIINRFNLGGPTLNVALLTRHLEPEYETNLVGGEKDDTEDSSEFIVHRLGLDPVIIPEMKRTIHPRQDWVAYWKLRRLIREYKPDIVHTHASKAGTLGRLAARHEKVPIIVHTFHGHVFHSYFGKLKTNFYKTIERYLARRSTRIIAISENQRKDLVERFRISSAKQTVVIPLGFELDRFREDREGRRKRFREKYGVDDNTVTIGLIGRLVPIKNHSLFLQALAEVKKQTQVPFRAFIVGDGESRDEIRQEATDLGLVWDAPDKPVDNPELTFTSWIREVDQVYPGLDLVALTSLNEGTPVSLIEAQAAGCAVVSTNVGGVENVVLPDQNALLSPSDDALAFSQNLLRLVEDHELRQQMNARGWDHVRQAFHYSRLAGDMRALYDQLLNR